MYLNELVQFLLRALLYFLRFMTYAIMVRVFLSWASMGQRRRGRFYQIVHEITEPAMKIARKLPHRYMMMDFSPIIAFIALDLLSQFILKFM